MTSVPKVGCIALVVSLLLATGGVGAQSSDRVTVTVTVHDGAGNPVSDVRLDVTWDGGSTTATTAANGKAFVDVPEGARATVQVTHSRYVRTDDYVITDASERDVDIRVYRKSSVRLEVRDNDGPVGNASVLIERGGLDVATGTTGPNGVFESDTLQAGTYQITVSKPGYYARQKPLEIDGDITNRVALTRGSTSVNVTVTDPYFDSPRPVRDATVELGDATEQTNRSGVVSLDQPVNTQPTLRVTKPGYRTVTREVAVGSDATDVSVDLSRTRTLTLESANERIVAGERVVLTATNAYGDPVPVASVTLDGERVGTTDGEGEVAVRIDEPGAHTLSVTADGVQSNEVTVEAISAGTDTAAATPTATTTSIATTTSESSPGFSALIAVVSILAVAATAQLGRR
ncbi:carboxypeptidase regulatory-like domain-containing protein [Haloplanus sp. C73]|uniref:carboxypeptidase regulatory-like domain-containing protein n=1 Tax=Haloplanus sp. C73 TaxID=3421641 RepID=UPI003EBDE5BA